MPPRSKRLGNSWWSPRRAPPAGLQVPRGQGMPSSVTSDTSWDSKSRIENFQFDTLVQGSGDFSLPMAYGIFCNATDRQGYTAGRTRWSSNDRAPRGVGAILRRGSRQVARRANRFETHLAMGAVAKRFVGRMAAAAQADG